ncbi:MAG TPA: NUDIX hydrolase [Anaerolineales bacterium]|nr:NUDIX hydrolase [Anaerolineales bacterium]
MGVQILESEIVYRGRALSVRRDRVLLAGGQETSMDVVVHSGAVTLVPIDEDGSLWFVRQYRHSAGTVLLEFPAGTLEDGEPPEQCAERECREEIGMAPARLEHLGECFLAPGYSTEYMHFYLASGLTAAPLSADSDEDITVERVRPERIPALIASGDLRDAKSLAALYLARAWLEGRRPG